MNHTEMYENDTLVRKIKRLRLIKRIFEIACSISFALAVPVFIFKFPNSGALFGYIALVVIIIATLIIITNFLAKKINRLDDYRKTGVVTEPEKLTHDVAVHKLCLAMFGGGVIGLFLTVIFAIASIALWPVILIISIALCVIGFIIGIKVQGKIENGLAGDINEKVQPRLAGLITTSIFQTDRHVENRFEAELIEGNCYTAGSYNGYEMEFSNLTISHYERMKSHGENGSSQLVPVKDFNGICIVFIDTKPINDCAIEQICEKLKEYDIWQIGLSEPNTLVILLKCTYFFVTQYGPDRVKTDSEIDVDIKKLNHILFTIEQAIRYS